MERKSWLPLAQQIMQWKTAEPLIVGFLGSQGSGKTTLTALLVKLLAEQGYRAISWSLDDLYLPYADRQRLQQQDPRLDRRGPPGTHDVAMGCAILTQLKAGQSSNIPRFDKSAYSGAGDRAGFETIAPVDFVLFEGWFVGVRPIAPAIFQQSSLPDPIRTDADRQFAGDMNQALSNYLPLWEKLDRLVVLNLQDYRWSKQWRQQAEQQMRQQGKPGMSDAAISDFVDYFWRALHPELFIEPMARSSWTDWVMTIGPDHLPC
jgi:D-glycerate 3-kinase